MQALIEAQATVEIGAEPYERAVSRTNERNGHRPRVLSTMAGDIELAISKLRRGSYFATIPRAPPAHRPGAVRHRHGGLRPGVSTRKVEDLVKALGMEA